MWLTSLVRPVGCLLIFLCPLDMRITEINSSYLLAHTCVYQAFLFQGMTLTGQPSVPHAPQPWRQQVLLLWTKVCCLFCLSRTTSDLCLFAIVLQVPSRSSLETRQRIWEQMMRCCTCNVPETNPRETFAPTAPTVVLTALRDVTCSNY